jgi:hypothetical protein
MQEGKKDRHCEENPASRQLYKTGHEAIRKELIC